MTPLGNTRLQGAPTTQSLAPEQLAGAVAEVGGADNAFVTVDAQAREGVKEAQVATAE